MQARQMECGKQYKIRSQKPRGFRVVEYDRPSNSPGDEGFAIVHERGELDLQSCFGIEWDETVEPVPDVSDTGLCPACGGQTEPTNNPHNPICRHNNAMCSCGWMGNVVPTKISENPPNL